MKKKKKKIINEIYEKEYEIKEIGRKSTAKRKKMLGA